MNNALENIKTFFGERGVAYYRTCFERLKTVKRVNRVFARISSAKDKEQLADYLAKIRYALIFMGLGFNIEFEPLGSKGPDLGITRDNQQVVVEVTRFRKIYDGPPDLNLDDENLTLVAYGNPKRDIRKAFEKILAKFPQVNNQKGIIAIWNDDEDLDESETLTAVFDISRDSAKGVLAIPYGLLFVLYGSKWEGEKQLYGFSFYGLVEPFVTWKTELEAKTVFGHIQSALSKRDFSD